MTTELDQVKAERDAAQAILASLGKNPMLGDFVRQACNAFRDLQAIRELIQLRLDCVEIDMAKNETEGRYELIVRKLIYEELLALLPKAEGAEVKEG